MKKLLNLTMFDLVKGIAMLGVVWGHSFTPLGNTEAMIWIGKILHSLLMPAFFVVSGYWLKNKNVKEGIKNSFKYLLVPFLAVMFFVNLIGFVHRFLQGNLEQWKQEFFLPTILVSTKGPNRLGAMWFVFTLFLAWCMFYLIVQIKNEKLQMIVVLLAAVVGGGIMPLELPYQIAQGLVGVFYVYCGYLLKKKKLLDKQYSPILYVVLLAVWLLSVFFGSMDLYSYDVKYGFFSIMGSLCGALLLIRLTLHINLLEWKVNDAISSIGRYSMWILCAHAIEKEAFPWNILFKFVPQNSAIGCWLHFLLRSILIAIFCWLFSQAQKIWNQYKSKGEEKLC